MDEIDPHQRCVGKPGNQANSVVKMQSHIAEALGLDRRKRFGHAVDKRFYAKKADLRMSLGLREHRFAAAEADFELNRSDRFGKQSAQDRKSTRLNSSHMSISYAV